MAIKNPLSFNRLAITIILVLTTSLMMVAAIPTQPVAAAPGNTLYVNPSSGVDSPSCLNDQAPCKTLSYAVSQAVAGDTISLAAGSYTAASGESFPIAIAKSLTITGTSSTATIIYRTGASKQVFTLSGAGTNVTFEKLTIRSGNDTGVNGGGILAHDISSLTLANVVVRNNSGYNGGGIAMDGGTLTVTDSNFISNTAQVYGGAIYLTGGTATITGTTFTSNIANRGGAIYNAGASISISNSQINGGNVTANGAGIYNAGGSTTVAGTTFTGNTATNGGAIYLQAGSVTLSDSSIGSGNSANVGAGLFQSGGVLSIDRSLFNGNTAASTGGAMALTGGTASVTNTTFTANTASGTNSEFGGGAIAVSGSANLALSSATLSQNNAASNLGGGLWVQSGSASAGNVLFDDSTCSGSFVDLGGSLENGASCGLPVERSNVAGFGLSALGFNGGSTQTLALLPGSPAIDAGSCVENHDQRGIARPKDGNADNNAVCDTGAYEFVAPTIAMPGDAMEYYEGEVARSIDEQATLDDDAPSYTGGVLTVSLGDGEEGTGLPEDRLSIISANPITLSGAYILYNNSGVIGTYSGGTSGSVPLVISLTPAATPEAVQALLRNIAYANISNAPDQTPRVASFTLNDGSGSTGNTATQTIHVHSINQLPEISEFSKSLSEDGYLPFDHTDFSANYSDEDGEPLVSVKITALPANGTLSILGDYVTLDQVLSLADLDVLSYTPDSNFFGSDSFQWDASDGTDFSGSPVFVDLSIIPVNDLPTLGDITKSANEDTTITFNSSDFSSQFTDTDPGDVLIDVKVVTLPENGTLKLGANAVSAGQVIPESSLGSLTYLGDPDYYGSDSFSWNASDSLDYSAAPAQV